MYIVFKTKEALRKGMIIVEEVFSRYGLTLSRSKTETMVVNGEESDTNYESIIMLGNIKIKNVKQFKYLGVQFAPRDNSTMIQHRIATASANFAEFKNMFKNHRINIKTRAFMNAYIRSRLTYNCSTLLNAQGMIKNWKLNGVDFYGEL